MVQHVLSTTVLFSTLFSSFPLHSLPPIVSSSFLLYLAPSETRHFIPVPSLLLYLHLSLPLQTCRRCCPASEGIWKLRLYPGNTRHPLILLRFTSPQHTSLQCTSPQHTILQHLSPREFSAVIRVLCIAHTISPHTISPHTISPHIGLLDGITV